MRRELRLTGGALALAHVALELVARRAELLANRMQQAGSLEAKLGIGQTTEIAAKRGQSVGAHARRGALHGVQQRTELLQIAAVERLLDATETRRAVGQ